MLSAAVVINTLTCLRFEMKKEILGNGIYVIGEMARGHKDIRPAEF